MLDPACGSGNFLYLALLALKDIEHRAAVEAEAQGLPRELPQIGPQAVKGIEINPYAAELARVTVWIGEIQWMLRNGFGAGRDPILKPLDTIECRDAILAADGGEAQWPAADVVIGNPPFLGDKLMIGLLGQDYVSALRHTYAGKVPGGADLVCYWFSKAATLIRGNRLKRAGLVATNSIRGGSNRAVLDIITQKGAITDAWADEPWVLDGAAVRVSLICFADHQGQLKPTLNGKTVDLIATDLTASGTDLTIAKPLSENMNVAFNGISKKGKFEISGETAREWLLSPQNPNGRANADVLHPWWNGDDITGRARDFWIVNFGEVSEREAALFELPFSHVQTKVFPARLQSRSLGERHNWWKLARRAPAMFSAIAKFTRFIVTPEVSKHRLFVWCTRSVTPDKNLIVIAKDDDTSFGILHSRFHEAWALRLGTSLEDRPRYTSTTTFRTFPFPEGLTPDRPAADCADDPRSLAIAAAARRLDELRRAWLSPPDLVARVPEVVAFYPDRIVPVDAKAAA
ncbi:MAG: class I SAM-dependent DNA methyltransferase, partial [Stellaceae bacterium]